MFGAHVCVSASYKIKETFTLYRKDNSNTLKAAIGLEKRYRHTRPLIKIKKSSQPV